MNTNTLSYLKQHAASLDLEEPLQISQHGVPVYRIYAEKQAQILDEAIALLKIANLAEGDIRNDDVMSIEKALENLK